MNTTSPVDTPPRFRYEEVQLTVLEAETRRHRELGALRDRRDGMAADLEALRDEITRLEHADLPTTKTEQAVLYPGDPGYDEAPLRLDPLHYQGQFGWTNIPSPTPEP